MEKPQSETPKSLGFVFPPHRRSHLKSETYRTLVRILSHCHDQSLCSLTTQIFPQDLRADTDSNELVQATEKETCKHGELVVSDKMEPENLLAQKEAAVDKHFESSGFQDKVSSDARSMIDEIEPIMGVEENNDMLQPKDKMINENTEGFGREQMIMDELKHLLEGKEALVEENSVNLSAIPVKENKTCSDIIAFMNNHEDHIDRQQIVMEEPGDAGQLQVDKEHHSQNVSRSIDASSDKNVVIEMPELNDKSADKNSSSKTTVMEVEHETQLQVGMELEKSAPTSGIMSSPVPMIEDGEIEDGEISGDFVLDEESIDLLCEDALISGERKEDEVQISEGIIDKLEFCSNENRGAKEQDSDLSAFITDMVDSGGKVELNGSENNKMVCELEIVIHGTSKEAKKAHGDDPMPKAGRNKKEGSGDKEGFGSPSACPKKLVYYGDILEENSSIQRKILEENSTENKALASTEQQNADDCKKKTRGPRSAGNKERKKEKKRKKRAEKNRQLGVKRLKLQPVLKPKTVTYCRHFLKGRCQEGEKCKFSHDTIPLTKSKPCCHFARHSCMKGDDCPFDHQLSKYPCINYTSKGSCSRGDACMFSHKMPLKEDSPTDSNACKPEVKPPSSLGDSCSKKQQNISGLSHQNVNALSYSVGINSHRNIEKNAVETILKPSELAPKGASFISLGKSPLVNSSKLKQGSSSLKMDYGAKVGQQIEQRASPAVQNLNDTPKRTPPVAPKGINFLSFGKAPLDGSSGNKLATMPSDRESVTGVLLLENHSTHKLVSSSPNQGSCGEVGKQTAESALSLVQNEMQKKVQPAAIPVGICSIPSAKSSVGDSSKYNNQDSLPSSSGSVIDRSSQEKQHLPYKLQNSSATQWRMPAPLAPGQSSEHSAPIAYRNTPSSAQKALWSTFAFAAKYESGMKINRTTGGANTEANKETSSNNSTGTEAKVSKILDFLSSIGSRTKQ